MVEDPTASGHTPSIIDINKYTMVGLDNSGPSEDPNGGKRLELKSGEESKPGARYLADFARRRDKMAKPDMEQKKEGEEKGYEGDGGQDVYG